LESTIDVPAYLDPPNELISWLGVDPRPVEIKKGLYGLKQSGRLWYEHLTKILLEMKMTKSLFDPCVFTLSREKSQISCPRRWHTCDI
jgi:hypothetical protein